MPHNLDISKNKSHSKKVETSKLKSQKCRFKHIPDVEKEVFYNSSCLLTISVGQEYHEGEKFKATTELVKNSFKSNHLMLYDSLQRYTMALRSNADADDFYEIATKQGDYWLERNSLAIENLQPHRIIRWSEWLSHPKFTYFKDKIETLKRENSEYNLAFEVTTNEFIKRFEARLPHSRSFNKTRAQKLCTDYLVEECTALCIWPETKCYVEVYPKPRNAAMDQTHKRLILPFYPKQLHSVELKFKNKSKLKAQKFFYTEQLEEAILGT